ncbi:hypothetical protein [Caldimonas sp.]|uniref:hypothetical protein n=1 Tax=Caldimonas sp. TaxID=2838790 RepID=UPI00391B2781
MRDPVMSLLREAVRAEISNAFEVIGHARPREVARVVCALHPSDVQSIGARLAEDALTDIARRELKRRPSKNERAQITLPGIPDALQAHLPPAISVPPPGVELESVDDEGVIYKPLAQATLADVDAHLALLGAQISADTRRHRALKELRDLALAAGATDDSPLLATLSTADLLMTEVVS